MKTVFVYKNELLALSETFIHVQARALKDFRARFVGLKPVQGGIPVGADSLLLTHDDSTLSKAKRRLFKELTFAPGFVRQLRAESPALIHSHFATDSCVGMRLAGKLGVPFITTLHGYDVTMREDVMAQSRDGRMYLARREELWSKCSKFLCSCDYILNRAAALGYPRHKMEVLYSGLDVDRLTPASSEKRNRNLILYVGRLVEKKGGPYLLRAVAQVARVNPAVELAIIGDGPLLEPMRALAAELKINCRFLGRLMNPEPGNSVHDWMRRARVFCGPSITASNGDTEGVPFVFVESHALGLPAVSFQSAGIGEAVVHGETGFLAPEKDIDALSHYLLQLLEDDALWNRFSVNGRQWIEQHFDLKRLTGQLQRVYSEAIEGAPKTTGAVPDVSSQRRTEEVCL